MGGVLSVVTFVALIALISGLLDGQQVLMAVLTGLASASLAWFGGHLAPRAWAPAGALTEPGMSMVVSVWVATAGLTWAYLVLVVELVGFGNPSFASWALGTWLLSPIASIMLLGAALLFGALDLWYTGPGLAPPFQWSTGAGDGVVMGDGRDWDARGLPLAVLAMVAGSLAALTVWLLARAGARSRGVHLSFTSAFMGRRPTSSRRDAPFPHA